MKHARAIEFDCTNLLAMVYLLDLDENIIVTLHVVNSTLKSCSLYFANNNNNLISRDLLKQRHIKNQERFIATRRFGVIVTPLSRD